MSPPNTSHDNEDCEGAGGAYDVDETTRLLLGLPSLVVTLGGGATSTATSCCSSACNSPKPDRSYYNDYNDRDHRATHHHQFLPSSLLKPQSHLPYPSSSPHPSDQQQQQQQQHHHHHHHHLSPRTAASSTFPIVASSVRSVFSDIHSECEQSKQEIHNESEFYLHSSIVARGTSSIIDGSAYTRRYSIHTRPHICL
jgi:hypothetical protein